MLKKSINSANIHYDARKRILNLVTFNNGL
jgi:hypothetical protein